MTVKTKYLIYISTPLPIGVKTMYVQLILPGLVALVTTDVLIVLLIRQKGSYFKDVKGYLVASCLAFAMLIIPSLILRLFPSEAAALYAGRVGVSACLVASVLLGLAALTLDKKIRSGFREGVHVREVFKEPLPMIYFIFLFITLILIWALPLLHAKPVTSFISRETIYVPVFESWYVSFLLMFIVLFYAYPCYRIISLSRWSGVNEKAAGALKGHGICWAGIGFSTLIFNGFLRSIVDVVEVGDVGFLISTWFLVIMAYLYRETTILESLPKTYSSLHLKEGEATVVLYNSAADKMKVFSAFIQEGLLNGDHVTYVYPDEESKIVRTKLKEHGIDVDRYAKDGTLRIISLSEYFLLDGNFDKERLIPVMQESIAEVKSKGYKHSRELVDLGDFSFLNGQTQLYIDYWNDPRWGPAGSGVILEPFLMELNAINVEGMSEEQVAELVKAFCGEERARLIDLLEHSDSFSKSLGLDREQLVGKRILFDFDPSFAYENVIQDFVMEAIANVETTVVFTSKGSPIHLALGQQRNIRFFLLTRQVSTPTTGGSEMEMFLPANNSSLILDAFEKMLNSCANERVSLVFDSLSELLISIGFEKTYSFLHYAFEMLGSKRVTAIFLLVSSAHDPKAVSSLRGLFDHQLVYGKEGIQAVKLSKAE